VRTAYTIAMIKRRFAGRDEAIAHAFAASESFRELCRDYLACVTTLARWRESDAADAPARAEEYAALVDELGIEIHARIRATERLRLHQSSNGGV